MSGWICNECDARHTSAEAAATCRHAACPACGAPCGTAPPAYPIATAPRPTLHPTTRAMLAKVRANITWSDAHQAWHDAGCPDSEKP